MACLGIDWARDDCADVVQLEMAAGQKLVFGGFTSLDLENFLALAWHFTSDGN